MTEYCTPDDVRKRLTTAGYQFFGDLDQSGGALSTTEVADTVTTAIVWAGNILDAEVERMGCESSVARGAGNLWLKDRAIDIAAYRVSTTGGNELEVLRQAFEDAMTLVRRTNSVPNLRYVYPHPQEGGSARFPKAINVRR